MILKYHCTICKEEQKVKSTTKLGERTIIRLSCGHSIFKEQVKEEADYSTIESIDGKRLFKFQADGCRSIEKADGQALLIFEMGLGKTPTAIAFLTLHDESRPAVIVCRSSLKRQIFRETVRWSNGKLIPQVIDSSKEKPSLGDAFALIGPSVEHASEVYRRIPGSKGYKRIPEFRNSFLVYRLLEPLFFIQAASAARS